MIRELMMDLRGVGRVMGEVYDLVDPIAAWRRWRAQRSCLHHNPHTGPGNPPETFLRWELIDCGMRRMHWCTVCRKHWFT